MWATMLTAPTILLRMLAIKVEDVNGKTDVSEPRIVSNVPRQLAIVIVHYVIGFYGVKVEPLEKSL